MRWTHRFHPTNRVDAAATVSVRALVARFALTGLAALILVVVVISYASRQAGTRQAISDAQKVTAVTTSAIVAPALDDGILSADPEALAALDDVIRRSVLIGSVVRVKVWATDGRVLYSDETELIGQQFPLGDDRALVFAGQASKAEVTDLTDDENTLEGDGPLLEVYQLTATRSGVPVLFEAYYRYSGVSEAGRQLWADFAPIAIGGLVILQLVQIPLAWSMARALRSGQQARERLLQHALNASDAERRRISNDLHDGVVQDLAGVSYTVAAMSKQDHIDHAAVDSATSTLRRTIKSLRSLLVEIYPPNLHDVGLESAVGDLLSRLGAKGINTNLTVDIDSLGVDRELTTVMFRVAQEALRNVANHAHARSVEVGITAVDANIVRMTVTDDGIGFSAAHAAERVARGHIGLRNLADLVEEFEGELSIESAPGQGARLVVELPLR